MDDVLLQRELAREFFKRTSVAAPIGLFGIGAVAYPHWDVVPHGNILLWAVMMLTPLLASTVFGRWALRQIDKGSHPTRLVSVEVILASLSGTAWGCMPDLLDTHALDPLFFYRIMVLCVAIIFVIPTLGHFVRVWMAFAGFMWAVALPSIAHLSYANPLPISLSVAIAIYLAMSAVLTVADNYRVKASIRSNLSVKRLSDMLVASEASLQHRVDQQTQTLQRQTIELRDTIIALKENEALLQQSQQLASVGYYVFDPKTQRFRASELMHRILGIPADAELTGESWMDQIHPQYREHVLKLINDHRKNGGHSQFTYPIIRKSDQAVRWISSLAKVELNPHHEIISWFGNIQDVTEQKESEQQIHELAFYDPLTNLGNRRLLRERLEHSLVVSERTQHYGAMLMLDLDNFKDINDTRGHAFGDFILTEVARRIKSCVRDVDTVCRFGGDEFVILIDGLDTDEHDAGSGAQLIAETVRLALAKPHMADNLQFHCPTSIGVCLFKGEEVDAETLMRQADLALYRAKDAGRNTIRFYKPSMQAAIDRRAQQETGLRTALENGEFELHFQPQVNMDGDLVGAEGLIRWITREGKLIPPNEFIPLAEESDLILSIGHWVLERGCAQLQQWQNLAHFKHLKLALNVSARQFRDPQFEEQVAHAIEKYGIDASRLKLELTESVVIDDVERVIDRLNALSALGITFSLDDFGTGYSSLSYLRQLPIDQIKIDRSFVKDVGIHPEPSAIVRAIIAMGTSLGLEVIAEGVEEERQRQFLIECGCTHFQGYLTGRPMPVDCFNALIHP